MVYTTRFVGGGTGGRNGFETELTALGVTQKNSRPNHPTTCGKVERFQQTMQRWLKSQTPQPRSIPELQQLLEEFTGHHNHNRPHRSLPHHATPAYNARPKAEPSTTHGTDGHYRVRHDTVDAVDAAGVVTLRHNGRLHHIGIGRTDTGTPVLLLVQNLDIRIAHAATGELLRELVLDSAHDYQTTGAPKGPETTNSPNLKVGSGSFRCPQTSHCRADRI
ncbi:integrase core domain-containing protein [Nocardia neocaledoniensis]|uniref:integrase core domain-containing protein n=1 Tax=Nocardia neocaledoniensis TaxID=236511 RepID=UPI002454F430|nr:integrase core domain-containing protein [Nocardia neocaledoniensis]